MKAIKWIVISLAALVVVGVAAVVIVITSYDYNTLKPEISAAVLEETGRELKIDGDVDLSISLSPSLVVEGVSFQNAPWGSRPQMVMVKRMELEVGLLALISGDVEVNRLVLIEPDILIETDAEGRSNLDMKPKSEEMPRKPKEAETAPKAEAPPGSEREKDFREGQRHLVLKEVRVENASLVYKGRPELADFGPQAKVIHRPNRELEQHPEACHGGQL
jgi:uncharacterized protein involved in outer membrane biogenesis